MGVIVEWIFGRTFSRVAPGLCPQEEFYALYSAHLRYRANKVNAEVAQLVERNLAKVEVASSNLVFRSESHTMKAGLDSAVEEDADGPEMEKDVKSDDAYDKHIPMLSTISLGSNLLWD